MFNKIKYPLVIGLFNFYQKNKNRLFQKEYNIFKFINK
jgi:hypothetical protein